MSIKDAAAAIHGEPGKAVVLSILHEGAKEPVTVEIVRRTIDLDTVRGDVRNADGSWNFFLPGHDHIGYVRIVGFAEKTPDDFRAALDWLAANHMRGLVIDLRDNPGGLLEAAAEICDMLIDSGAIVSTCGRDKRPLKVIEASGQGPFTKFPLAVLINQDSASASEIVAACLQDHRRAVIVGERSFGKGTVQEVSELGDHRGMLKLTVASYWRPSGKNIHREHDATAKDVWGVMPDEGYKVVVNEDDFKRLDQARQRRDIFRPGAEKPAGGGKPPTGEDVVDRQLDKAVQCVESKAK
jgi:carboxyl-terminal processing protease